MVRGQDEQRRIGTECCFGVERAQRDRRRRVAPERLQQVHESRGGHGPGTGIRIAGLEVIVAIGDRHQRRDVRQPGGAQERAREQRVAGGAIGRKREEWLRRGFAR